MKKRPPHPPNSHFLLGNIPEFMKSPLAFFEKQEKTFPDICWMKSPFRKVCIVYNPDYIKYILQENNKSYTKSFGYDQLKLLLGNGLLTSEGEFWIRQRRMAQPAFHKERINRLVTIMGDCVIQVINEWEKKYRDEDVINFSYEMNRLALLIVSRTLFRSEIKEEDIQKINHSLGIAIEAGAEKIRNPFKLPQWIPTKKNRIEKNALSEIHQILKKLINQRLKDNNRYDDLLDMLIHAQDEETGEKMSSQQLLDEVATIFIAGHETTANALTFTWYLLAMHPEVDKLVIQEIKSVLDKAKPLPEDLQKMQYLRQVIDESLRLFPPAWIIGRQSLRDEKFGDYLVPAGTTMALPTYVVQRSNKNWSEPNIFNPDRFKIDQLKEIKKFTYFPFGGGPRLCIGNMFTIFEMLICISIIRKNYSISLDKKFKFELDPLITLRLKNPLHVKLKKE